MLDIFDDEAGDEKAHEAMAALDQDLWEQIQLNFSEWLLAEGDILVKGKHERVAELLVGPRGPRLTAGQRGWLEQLSSRPLRLYDITEVVVGQGITLCDALDTDQPPLRVIERAGSRSLRVGMQIGARVMQVAGQHQLSGAIYPFTAWSGRAVLDRLRARITETGEPDEYDVLEVGMQIMDGWLEQYLVPAPLPEIIHGSSGEPLLFHTDHYDVLDWDALSAALAAQADVGGDREAGWDRFLDGADGLTRSQARIEPATGGSRVSLRCPTAGLAEQGRVWFDALAGGTVKFRLRELSDPKGMLSKAESATPTAAQSAALPPGLDPEAMAAVMETFIHRHYAKWPTNRFPCWAARLRDRRSRARPGWSASRACCAAIRTANRGRPHNKGGARFPTSSCGMRWSLRDSRALAGAVRVAGSRPSKLIYEAQYRDHWGGSYLLKRSECVPVRSKRTTSPSTQ